MIRKRAALTSFSRRLTPVEVAQLWFRRAGSYARAMHADHPDLPSPGPDGLYLASEIEAWFDRWHGRRASSPAIDRAAEDEAMRIARG